MVKEADKSTVDRSATPAGEATSTRDAKSGWRWSS
jgi:hypothetical protein